jgi:hypothetical protein
LRARQHRLTTPSLPFILLVLLGDLVASFDQHDVVVEEYVLKPLTKETPNWRQTAFSEWTSALWNAT